MTPSTLFVTGALEMIASIAVLLRASMRLGVAAPMLAALDLALAAGLFVTLVALYRATCKIAPGSITARMRKRADTLVSCLPSAILIGLWPWHAQLDWNVLLPGLAWRLFVLLSAILLIPVLAATRGPASVSGKTATS